MRGCRAVYAVAVFLPSASVPVLRAGILRGWRLAWGWLAVDVYVAVEGDDAGTLEPCGVGAVNDGFAHDVNFVDGFHVHHKRRHQNHSTASMFRGWRGSHSIRQGTPCHG